MANDRWLKILRRGFHVKPIVASNGGWKCPVCFGDLLTNQQFCYKCGSGIQWANIKWIDFSETNETENEGEENMNITCTLKDYTDISVGSERKVIISNVFADDDMVKITIINGTTEMNAVVNAKELEKAISACTYLPIV